MASRRWSFFPERRPLPSTSPSSTSACRASTALVCGTDAAALRHLAPEGRTHLHSNERGRIHLVPLTDILFLRAELKYVTAQTREREYLIEESLSHLEEEFGERFIRIHRNCLAARNAITGVERAASESGDSPDGGEARWMVLLRDFAGKLPVSRRQWSQVKALLREE